MNSQQPSTSSDNFYYVSMTKDSQRDAIKKLRQTFPKLPDYILIKYLIGERFKISKAIAKIENRQKWIEKRADIWKYMDSVELDHKDKNPEWTEMRQSGMAYISGMDKDKHLNLVVKAGVIYKQVDKHGARAVVDYLIYLVEHGICKQWEPLNPDKKINILYDRLKHSGGLKDIPKYRGLFQMIGELSAYYPEILNKAFVTRTNALLKFGLAAFKLVIDKKTYEKIILCKSVTKLQKYGIGPDQLEKCLGGTGTVKVWPPYTPIDVLVPVIPKSDELYILRKQLAKQQKAPKPVEQHEKEKTLAIDEDDMD